MRRAFSIAAASLLLAVHAPAVEIADEPAEWTLHAWINPPTSNSVHMFWIRSDGTVTIMGKQSAADRIELDTKVGEASLRKVFAAAREVISGFVMKPSGGKRYRADDADKWWNMNIILDIGAQQVQVADLRMMSLAERPSLEKLARLINSIAPEEYRVELDMRPPTKKSTVPPGARERAPRVP